MARNKHLFKSIPLARFYFIKRIKGLLPFKIFSRICRTDVAYLLTASLRSLIEPMSCSANTYSILIHLHIAVTPDTVDHVTSPDNSNPILVRCPQISRGSQQFGEKPFHHKKFCGFFLTISHRHHDCSVDSLFAVRCDAGRPAEKCESLATLGSVYQRHTDAGVG